MTRRTESSTLTAPGSAPPAAAQGDAARGPIRIDRWLLLALLGSGAAVAAAAIGLASGRLLLQGSVVIVMTTSALVLVLILAQILRVDESIGVPLGKIALGAAAVGAGVGLIRGTETVFDVPTILSLEPTSGQLTTLGLLIVLGYGAVLAFVGAGRLRPDRLIASSWWPGGTAFRIAATGVWLEILGWLAMVTISTRFGFIDRASQGVALVIAAFVIARWGADRDVGRPRLGAMLALVPGAGAALITWWQFEEFLRITSVISMGGQDGLTFLAHVAGVVLLLAALVWIATVGPLVSGVQSRLDARKASRLD